MQKLIPLCVPPRISVDDEEDEKPSQGASKVHRAVFPRDFGRQNAKDVERRVELVIGYGSMPLLQLNI